MTPLPPELESLIAAWRKEFGFLAQRFADLRSDVDNLKRSIRNQETKRKDDSDG